MPCDFCKPEMRAECDARDDHTQGLQLSYCKENKGPLWATEEDLVAWDSGEPEREGASTEKTAPEQPSPKARAANGKPSRKCAGCNTVKPIIGRGLCGNCYQKAKKAGTLLPLLGSFPGKKAETAPEQPKKSEEPNSGGALASFAPPLPSPSAPPDPEPAKPLSVSVRVEEVMGSINLTFAPSERDQALLRAISMSAEEHRRATDQEILWIVQAALEHKEEFLRDHDRT